MLNSASSTQEKVRVQKVHIYRLKSTQSSQKYTWYSTENPVLKTVDPGGFVGDVQPEASVHAEE